MNDTEPSLLVPDLPRPKPSPAQIAQEDALIAAYLKRKRPTRQPAEKSPDVDALMDEVRKDTISVWALDAPKFQRFLIDNRHEVDREELWRRANKSRAARGLRVWGFTTVRWTRVAPVKVKYRGLTNLGRMKSIMARAAKKKGGGSKIYAGVQAASAPKADRHRHADKPGGRASAARRSPGPKSTV